MYIFGARESRGRKRKHCSNNCAESREKAIDQVVLLHFVVRHGIKNCHDSLHTCKNKKLLIFFDFQEIKLINLKTEFISNIGTNLS